VEADFAAGRHARVVVAGHADRSGPDAYNESLSERRARTVAEALAARDLPASAMAVEWHGERQPRVAQADGTKEPQNRRVEITFR
jgi:outer membrane protein OmpA-like peptidoglycan-associated protein